MPRPVIKEDIFSWKTIQFNFSDNCLEINAEIQGRCSNIDNVYVEIDEKCLKCPFTSSYIIIPKIEKKGCFLRIKCCGIKKRPFRFRLRGISIYRGLDQISSPYTVY